MRSASRLQILLVLAAAVLNAIQISQASTIVGGGWWPLLLIGLPALLPLLWFSNLPRFRVCALAVGVGYAAVVVFGVAIGGLAYLASAIVLLTAAVSPTSLERRGSIASIGFHVGIVVVSTALIVLAGFVVLAAAHSA